MCTYQSLPYWLKVNEDGTKKFQVRIEKKDDYFFGMMQLKGLHLFQIIVQYGNFLCAKFDFEKVKQNKVREDLVQSSGKVSKMDV